MLQAAQAAQSDVWTQFRAIRQNDESVLGQLYASNYPRVESFVVNNSGTADQAKDVFQEAFIAVWRNIQLDRFQPQSGAGLDAYLFQIAKNKWMDYLRSGHYTKVVRMNTTVLSAREDDEAPAGEHEYLAAVKKHFAALGDNCKKVLTMFYYDNESMKQIADQMNWTEATAKNNKYRCIQKLKELINQQS
ncbi:MAG: sigma-70 family RNA polymerase sigma factor [Chitinophagaceae bacterium]